LTPEKEFSINSYISIYFKYLYAYTAIRKPFQETSTIYFLQRRLVMKKSIALLVLISALLFVIPTGEALAEGTETLGAPLISIEPGTGIVAAGVGLSPTGAGSINFVVPAGATVKQALLYWEGWSVLASPPPTDTILVNSDSVTGDFIGGRKDTLGDQVQYLTYRADITDEVTSGANTLAISDVDFDQNDGAGVLVIIDDGSTAADIEIRDGNDRAFIFSLESNGTTTVPQVFTFDPASSDRIATLAMFFASVSGTASGGNFRPTAINVTVGGVTTVYDDLLDSNDGEEWDTVTLSVPIPAGATMLTVQALSVDNLGGETGTPASFAWIAAGLSVPPPEGGEGCTPGYWRQEQHFDSWIPTPYTPGQTFSAVFGCSITIKWSETGKPQEVTNPTLLQALEAKGGGESALARHAVAALLNAANPDVSYPRTEEQIKTMVCNALSSGDIEETKNTLAGWNEEFCPLD
jgi:hypothetical protein